MKKKKKLTREDKEYRILDEEMERDLSENHAGEVTGDEKPVNSKSVDVQRKSPMIDGETTVDREKFEVKVHAGGEEERHKLGEDNININVHNNFVDRDFDEGEDEKALPPPPGIKLESPAPSP